MLKVAIRLIITLIATSLLVVGTPLRATAKAECVPKTILIEGKVTIIIVCPGDDGSAGGGKNTRNKCYRLGKEVPCHSKLGTWYAPKFCWIDAMNPQPAHDDPTFADIWNGHKDGTIYLCYSGLGGSPGYVWLPGGTVAPPNPADLAARAVEQMNLRAPVVGIVPEARAGYRGAVGLPVWLWVDDPGPSVTGPISRTASLRGYSVTATGRLDRIEYSMGDGRDVSCAGTRAAGTRYEDRYGVASSPTCGYRYTKQGKYQVTATAYWTIEWTGMGQDGELDYEFTRSVRIAVGEIQVLVTQKP